MMTRPLPDSLLITVSPAPGGGEAPCTAQVRATVFPAGYDTPYFVHRTVTAHALPAALGAEVGHLVHEILSAETAAPDAAAEEGLSGEIALLLDRFQTQTRAVASTAGVDPDYQTACLLALRSAALADIEVLLRADAARWAA